MERATFFARLRQSRLLSDAELEQAASRFGDTEPAGIADALVSEGVLTGFQAQQVCAGDTQPLALGQYRLLDELGRGGMGRVYKALHTIMGRIVAVKVISPELVQNPVAVEWFRREVRASTHLVHPNIVMAYDANEAEGLHFLVMEYVPGVTLDRLVKQQGPLPIEHACALMRQAALGLQHAHEKGMVHRDIKPGNLLIPQPAAPETASGAGDVLVKIVDFGLARLHGKSQGDTIALRAQGDVLGTPDYIAPEQSRDIHAADIRSDLYSLGCTFYFALTGRVPFPGENAMEKLIKHMMEEPDALEKVRPDVPPSVTQIVRRLMAKNPDERFQTPAELVQALDAWSAEPLNVSPAPPTACRPLWIAPPTGVHPNPAASEPALPTRVLEFVQTPDDDSPSNQIVLEPIWKYAPGETRQEATHDTVSLSQADHPEATTAMGDSEKPVQPVPSERAVSDSVPPRRIHSALRRHWRRWTALIETIAKGHGAGRVHADTYRDVYTTLLHVCRLAVEAAPTPQRRAHYEELVSIVQPWLNLQTFTHTEPQILASLLRRCRQIELELNDGNVPWTARQVVGMILLMLSPVGLALWYWNSGRLWLPALVQSFHWNGPKPEARSVWRYIETHPSLLMGVVFPVVIVFSIYLLYRTPRT